MSDLANISALSDFVAFHNLRRDAFGRCWFTAYVVIKAGGRGGAETLKARISFASGDREQLVLDNGSVIEPGKLPLSYRTKFGIWRHQSGLLLIKGNYRREFDYQTEITIDS